MKKIILISTIAVSIFGFLVSENKQAIAKNEKIEILNVSYDPTRELYDDYNKLFSAHWKEKTGERLKVSQSHGGSGKQARSVIDGLEADIVTLALAYDIDVIAEKANLLPKNWEEKFENHSTPYTSTIVFLVKKNNPKNIKDWGDLVKNDVKVITPNPKTSGGARWNYLAALAYAQKANNKDEAKSEEYLKQLFKNVPVLDAGARGSTTTFAQRGIGDVLITWENEAFLAKEEFGKDRFEIVYPSISILAEPPVAVVDKIVEKRGTKAVATEYLKFLYTKEAQRIIAKHHFRPIEKEVAEEFTAKFPAIELVNIRDFGGWKEVQTKHFDDGGVFDKIIRR
ncbi:MAG: sulfate ABC transporter substrate-binding protein [Rickettsiales bacterium]|nr:sulfate ABC transporter substrate-binding protein [Rickettsiales bacterium]